MTLYGIPNKADWDYRKFPKTRTIKRWDYRCSPQGTNRMHWDNTLSIGNIISACMILAALLIAFSKFVASSDKKFTALTTALKESAMSQSAALALVSAATNNLAAITERLQIAVEKQDSRILTLETEQIIRKEVGARLAAEHIKA